MILIWFLFSYIYFGIYIKFFAVMLEYLLGNRSLNVPQNKQLTNDDRVFRLRRYGFCVAVAGASFICLSPNYEHYVSSQNVKDA